MCEISCVDFKQDVYGKIDTRAKRPSNKYKTKTNIITVLIKSRVVYNPALNKNSGRASMLEEAKDKRPQAITKTEMKSTVATKEKT